MNFDRNNQFVIDDKTEKELFLNALIFFDTSVLLDFHFYSSEAKLDISKNIFEKLKGRLWMTNHTQYEFLKNNEAVKSKLASTYDLLLQKSKSNKDNGGHVSELENHIKSVLSLLEKSIEGQLKTLIEKTTKPQKHPFIQSNFFDNFLSQTQYTKDALISYSKQFSIFKENINNEVKAKKKQIEETNTSDEVIPILEQYFQVTNPYNFEKLILISKEGSERYKNKIPPGYMDDEDKIGLQKYGDLIIWKQIIEKSKEEKKPVIFVVIDL